MTLKRWRAIYLLRVVSNLLKRIVLRRLQDSEGEEGRKQGKTTGKFRSRRNKGITDTMTALIC